MSERLADVDLRNGEYLVSSYSRTKVGFWICRELPQRLAVPVMARALGLAVRQAIDASGGTTHAPDPSESPVQELLDTLGLPNYAAYILDTRSVEIRADGVGPAERIVLTPRRNDGPERGFTPLKRKRRKVVYESPGQLGGAVLAAFDDAW